MSWSTYTVQYINWDHRLSSLNRRTVCFCEISLVSRLIISYLGRQSRHDASHSDFEVTLRLSDLNCCG